MIPPSIVLIIYGLVTETSIKALFTAAFLPGFMLASFFIIYIIVRTQLNPDQAPLPDPVPGEPEGAEKAMMFLGFLSKFGMWVSGVLIGRALFFTVFGQNTVPRRGGSDLPRHGGRYSLAGGHPWWSLAWWFLSSWAASARPRAGRWARALWRPLW